MDTTQLQLVISAINDLGVAGGQAFYIYLGFKVIVCLIGMMSWLGALLVIGRFFKPLIDKQVGNDILSEVARTLGVDIRWGRISRAEVINKINILKKER